MVANFILFVIVIAQKSRNTRIDIFLLLLFFHNLHV